MTGIPPGLSNHPPELRLPRWTQGPPGASFPPTQSPLPWTDVNIGRAPQDKRAGLHLPLQNLSLLSACQKQRIYCLIHFEQNLFLEIFMMEE